MEIDEEDLYKNIKLAISSLYISDECNNKVLQKNQEIQCSILRVNKDFTERVIMCLTTHKS